MLQTGPRAASRCAILLMCMPLGGTAALSLDPLSPLRPFANAAGPLGRAQISGAQTVIRGRVFARGLEAMLRDGRTDLIALTSALRVAAGR